MKNDEGQLIHEKITVPEQSPRVSRRRLFQLLTSNLSSYNATILSGRAGTGKTTLAAEFARQAGRAAAWYKVDGADCDLRLFCEYLSKTVMRHRSLDQDRLLQLTETIESDRADLLAETFVFQLSEGQSDPLLIIIEDLHLIYDADWVVPFMRRLMPLLPTDVHLLITCRSLPPASLWRLRSKQMLRVMDEAELAFTEEEAIQLFESYGLGEDAALVAWRQTNGRAAAIAEFAATPGRAGRAVADNYLSIKQAGLECLTGQTPNFQT